MTEPEIHSVEGVLITRQVALITPQVAADLVAALSLVERLAPVPLVPRLSNLRRQLAAYANACDNTSAQVDFGEVLQHSETITTKQAALRLKTTEANVRDLCNRGRLAAMRPGGRWRISRESVEEYRLAREQKRTV
jgi:excisionase family DNA binding protein